MSNCRIALLQTNPTVGDIAGNQEKLLQACQHIETTYTPDIIVTSECAITGYPAA